MSSETSTDVQSLPSARSSAASDAGLQPWQLFTLAGLIGAAVVAFFASARPPSVRIALILTVFAAAAIGVAVLGLLLPLIGRRVWEVPVVLGGRTRAALERDKALLLRSLKELEFDRAMGKVSEADFDEMSARLRGRAARILRQLDAGSGYRAQIERELEKRLQAKPAPGSPGAPVQPATAQEPAVRACASCGSATPLDAKFCQECGHRLETR